MYGSLRYGIKFANGYENEIMDRFDQVDACYFTHGIDVKFAVGYRI
jgi:hypothetical protein